MKNITKILNSSLSDKEKLNKIKELTQICSRLGSYNPFDTAICKIWSKEDVRCELENRIRSKEIDEMPSDEAITEMFENACGQLSDCTDEDWQILNYHIDEHLYN